MLRSFLVPKISTTTSRTISQCQMLNEPIAMSPSAVPLRTIIGPSGSRAADDVDVDMHARPAGPRARC